MKVVISQPMFFPWVGMYEQIRLADVFVHYGDVQFSKGSFTNRVQIKTAHGNKWLTVPLQQLSLGQSIDEVLLDTRTDWRRQHLGQLRQAYAAAPYRNDMLALVKSVYELPHATIGQLSRETMMAGCSYYGLEAGRRFVEVGEVLGGTRYITGLGARHYLDHQLFEDAGIRVEYMDYRKLPYPQQHGEFTPYVSLLDLIANTGPQGIEYIVSGTQHWNDFLHHE
jgi:hypothetical protein